MPIDYHGIISTSCVPALVFFRNQYKRKGKKDQGEKTGDDLGLNWPVEPLGMGLLPGAAGRNSNGFFKRTTGIAVKEIGLREARWLPES
jgi:hypothetical protein